MEGRLNLSRAPAGLHEERRLGLPHAQSGLLQEATHLRDLRGQRRKACIKLTSSEPLMIPRTAWIIKSRQQTIELSRVAWL